MKYATITSRGSIVRISATEPRESAHTTTVELTDEQAAPVEAGLAQHPRLHFFWNGAEVLNKEEWREWSRWNNLTLEEAKAAKIRELEAARYQAEIAGITLPGGQPIRTDKETQAELGKALSIISTVNPALEIDWKFPDGTVERLDAATVQQIAGAVFAHVQATRTAYKTLAAQVAAATTKSELKPIAWS